MRKIAIFGHVCIVLGCYLLAWGIYLIPNSQDVGCGAGYILTHPLFWGLFSIFGGICANAHSRCRCVRDEWPRRRERE